MEVFKQLYSVWMLTYLFFYSSNTEWPVVTIILYLFKSCVVKIKEFKIMSHAIEV